MPTEKEILQLYRDNDLTTLEAAVKELGSEAIIDVINQRYNKSKDIVVLVRALLKGLDASQQDLYVSIYKTSLQILPNNKLPSASAAELVGLLLFEVYKLTGCSLVKLSNLFIDNVKRGAATHGKWLDLFPQILCCIKKYSNIEYNNDVMSGEEYSKDLLNKLMSSKWHSHAVLPLTTMFKDVTLSDEERLMLFEKVMRMFSELDLQELPPLIYQLFVLSKHGQRKAVLEGIIAFFVREDLKDTQTSDSEDISNIVDKRELHTVEGTAMVHIIFTMKQDHQLAKTLIKYLKDHVQASPEHILVSFPLALALSLSRVNQYQDQIMDTLKSAVLQSYSNRQKLHECAWLREQYIVSGDVASQVLATVEGSEFGWDQVIQGIVQLGFLLMDSFGPKAVFGKVIRTDTKSPTTPTQHACYLGARILAKAFKVHDMVHKDILESLVNRVITKATVCTSHYTDLLHMIVNCNAQGVAGNITPIQELIDYMPALPIHTSLPCITALQPLLTKTNAIKDALLIMLRKALYTRSVDGRVVSIKGYLAILHNSHLLTNISVSQISSSSQSLTLSQVDIHRKGSVSKSSTEALCLEVIGNMRRSLTQQADVRLALYQGVTEVLENNPNLERPVLAMLVDQCMKYYEEDTAMLPPLKLQPCIQRSGENVYLNEPLAHLIATAVRCTVIIRKHKSDLGDDDSLSFTPSQSQGRSSANKQLDKILTSITDRILKSEMEDFELDKSSDFSNTSSVGIKNQIYAILLLGVYEAVMEYLYCTTLLTLDDCNKILTVFDNYQQLSDLLSNKSQGTKGGKAAAGTSKQKQQATTLMSVDVVTRFCQQVVNYDSNDTSSGSDGLQVLQDKRPLVLHMLTAANQKLQAATDEVPSDATKATIQNNVKNYCILAGVAVEYYSKDLTSAAEHRQSTNRQIATMCLTILSSATTVITRHYTQHLSLLMAAIVSDDNSASAPTEDLRKKAISKLQTLIESVLSSTEDDRNVRECITLLTCMTMINKTTCDYNTPAIQESYQWINQMCENKAIDDNQLVKALLQYLYDSMYALDANGVVMLVHFAQDIHSRLGDVDQDIEVEMSRSYAVVTDRTVAPTVVCSVISNIDRQLDDIDSVICRMKDAVNNNVDLSDSVMSQCENRQRQCCVRLGMIINMLHELCQTALPMGPGVDGLIKTLAHMYNTLTACVKYNLWLYTAKMGHLIPSFEKLVKVSGIKLTPVVYSFLTYVQVSQSESLQVADKKKKKEATNTEQLRAQKESKNIPTVVYAIEQYENSLIKLSKKCKVNLMQYIRVGTSRDFRISTDCLREAIEAHGGAPAVTSSSSSDDSSGEEDDGEEGAANEESQKGAGSDEENVPPPDTTKSGGGNTAGKTVEAPESIELIDDTPVEEPAAKKQKTTNQNRLKKGRKTKN